MTLDAIDPAAPEVHLPPQSIMAVTTNNDRSGTIGPQRSRRRCLRSFAVALGGLPRGWPAVAGPARLARHRIARATHRPHSAAAAAAAARAAPH